MLTRSSAFVAALALLVLTSAACKRKAPPPPYVYVPPPRVPTSFYALSSLCSATSSASAYDGSPAYVKGSSAVQVSKLAAFRRYTDDKHSSYSNFALPTGALEGDVADLQLVACVDVAKEPGEPGHCSYYGGELLLYKMKNTLRVLEVKTGREVLKEEFILDHKTGRCPGTYAFPKGSNSVYEGIDIGPKLTTVLLSLEPEGLTFPEAKASKLDDVCSGSAVPQAAAYVPGTPTRVHLVYFPDGRRSDTREDPPAGMPPFDDLASDASAFGLVACITGQAKKKKRDCEFSSGKTLTVSDGEFEVRLIEARTGKPVETKAFKGTSGGGCPFTHKFWGNKGDDVITKVEPALGKYVATLEGTVVAKTSARNGK